MRKFIAPMSIPTELKSPPFSMKYPWDAVVACACPQLVMVSIEGRDEARRCPFRKENPHMTEILAKGDPKGIILKLAKFMGQDYIVGDVFKNSAGRLYLSLVAKDPENNICTKERLLRGGTKIELQDKIDGYIEYRRVKARKIFDYVNKTLIHLLPQFSYEVGEIRFEGERCAEQ